MRPIVPMHTAKTHLSRLAEEVARSGEPVLIARHGKPLVQLSPLQQPLIQTRKAGQFRGLVRELDETWPIS